MVHSYPPPRGPWFATSLPPYRPPPSPPPRCHPPPYQRAMVHATPTGLYKRHGSPPTSSLPSAPPWSCLIPSTPLGTAQNPYHLQDSPPTQSLNSPFSLSCSTSSPQPCCCITIVTTSSSFSSCHHLHHRHLLHLLLLLLLLLLHPSTRYLVRAPLSPACSRLVPLSLTSPTTRCPAVRGTPRNGKTWRLRARRVAQCRNTYDGTRRFYLPHR